jgi:hypothetical protein
MTIVSLDIVQQSQKHMSGMGLHPKLKVHLLVLGDNFSFKLWNKFQSNIVTVQLHIMHNF